MWCVISDTYTFAGGARSLHLDVVAALDRYFYETAATDAVLKQHAVKLAKLARAVLRAVHRREPVPVERLRAYWQSLPEPVREAFEEAIRYRHNVLPDGDASLQDCVITGPPGAAARAIWRACSFGAQPSQRRRPRGAGKRQRKADLSPIMAFGTRSGGQARPHVDALVQALGLICHEARGEPRKRDAAFADLVARVFQVADLSGAAERVSIHRAAQKGKPRRQVEVARSELGRLCETEAEGQTRAGKARVISEKKTREQYLAEAEEARRAADEARQSVAQAMADVRAEDVARSWLPVKKRLRLR
jgi:hypothetical protein